MAILIEALSLVIRVQAIDSKFQGGWDAFVGRFGGPYLCTDGELARLSATSGAEAMDLAAMLEGYGLVFRDGAGVHQDMIIVEQLRGPAADCDWLEWGSVIKHGFPLSVARMAGSFENEVATPPNWAFDFSPSDLHRRVEKHDLPKDARYVGHNQGLHIYAEPNSPRRLYVRGDELLF